MRAKFLYLKGLKIENGPEINFSKLNLLQLKQVKKVFKESANKL